MNFMMLIKQTISEKKSCLVKSKTELINWQRYLEQRDFLNFRTFIIQLNIWKTACLV